jgi:hypothetical protein
LQRTLEALLKIQPEIKTALSFITALARRSGAQRSYFDFNQSVLSSVVSAAAKHAGDAVSRGNKKVFVEIAREFSRFISDCFSDTSYVQSHIDNFCQQLKAGPPPEGQEYLRKGFQYYYQAFFEQDQSRKVQLNFLANLLVGFHEQNRLQP